MFIRFFVEFVLPLKLPKSPRNAPEKPPLFQNQSDKKTKTKNLDSEKYTKK